MPCYLTPKYRDILYVTTVFNQWPWLYSCWSQYQTLNLVAEVNSSEKSEEHWENTRLRTALLETSIQFQMRLFNMLFFPVLIFHNEYFYIMKDVECTYLLKKKFLVTAV